MISVDDKGWQLLSSTIPKILSHCPEHAAGPWATVMNRLTTSWSSAKTTSTVHILAQALEHTIDLLQTMLNLPLGPTKTLTKPGSHRSENLVEIARELHDQVLIKCSVLLQMLTLWTTTTDIHYKASDLSTITLPLLCQLLELVEQLLRNQDQKPATKATSGNLLKQKISKKQAVAQRQRMQRVTRKQARKQARKQHEVDPVSPVHNPSSQLDVVAQFEKERSKRLATHQGTWRVSSDASIESDVAAMLLTDSGWSCCGRTQYDSICTAVHSRPRHNKSTSNAWTLE